MYLYHLSLEKRDWFLIKQQTPMATKHKSDRMLFTDTNFVLAVFEQCIEMLGLYSRQEALNCILLLLT